MSRPERGSIQGNTEQKPKAEERPPKPPKPPSPEKVVLKRWIDDKVPLVFLLKSGRELRGQLLWASTYEYFVQLDGDDTGSLLHKHAVDLIRRASEGVIHDARGSTEHG